MYSLLYYFFFWRTKTSIVVPIWGFIFFRGGERRYYFLLTGTTFSNGGLSSYMITHTKRVKKVHNPYNLSQIIIRITSHPPIYFSLRPVVSDWHINHHKKKRFKSVNSHFLYHEIQYFYHWYLPRILYDPFFKSFTTWKRNFCWVKPKEKKFFFWYKSLISCKVEWIGTNRIPYRFAIKIRVICYRVNIFYHLPIMYNIISRFSSYIFFFALVFFPPDFVHFHWIIANKLYRQCNIVQKSAFFVFLFFGLLHLIF